MATLLAVIWAEDRARRGLPAAIAITVLTLVIAALAACDPGYSVTIKNDTNATLVLWPGEPGSHPRLNSKEEIKVGQLEDEPFRLVAADPKGRRLEMLLTKAELEERNFIVVIRSEDFEATTPTAPSSVR